MGLDMYLSRRCYVKNWDHLKPEDRHEIIIKRGGKIRDDIVPTRISYIEEEVAYWRKANAIHGWFVEQVQEGVDDCGQYTVTIEQLKELIDACQQVLDTVKTVEGDVITQTIITAGQVEQLTKKGEVIINPEIAENILPSKSGFFFGNTSYNEYYLQDLQDTVRMLTPLLKDTEGKYIYHASW